MHRMSDKDWKATEAPLTSCRVDATSADGSRLLATCYDGVYISVDAGATWSLLTNAPALGRIACSADGSIFAGALPISRAFSSVDSGQTWQTVNIGSSTNWAVTCSADGRLLVAASDFGINI